MSEGRPAGRPSRFVTADRERAREFLAEAYNGVRVTCTPVAGTVATLTRIDAGPLTFTDLTSRPEAAYAVDGGDTVVVLTLLEGTIERDRGTGTDRYGRGDVLLAAAPALRHRGRAHQVRAQTLQLPAALLTDVAGAAPDGAPVRWSFLSQHPAGPRAAAQWRHAHVYAMGLLRMPAAVASPLVMGHATRLLAATALVVFPNTLTGTGFAPAEHTGPVPHLVRRATQYIEDNAHRDITLADIAGSVRLTPRAVQYAFRRHLDTTPMAHLRQVRLAQAHADLRTAGPGSGVTVAGIAARWGFANPGRFAALYRRTYGTNPRGTLDG
ncbi:helix-turn-helix transcriptional regulator [Streptomyces sp. CRN 30]|uniref:helix-turn-helix transcriptional regulator n=1 Tax=Streptomyces sp. CRN 30 TaxID=3075613 RepID=UPI002A7F2977|nr:helix-turn-helix transcriptional regulator [Streptomyces sp. CRN 30]